MYKCIYIPPERFVDSKRLEKRLWSHYPIVPGEQRDVCELYNNGEHLYARQFAWKKPTPYFVWLPYRDTRPLVRYYAYSGRDVVNLKNPEKFRLYLDGHLGNTVVAMLDFGCLGTSIRIQRYLVIPKDTTLKVELQSKERRVNIVFTQQKVS